MAYPSIKLTKSNISDAVRVRFWDKVIKGIGCWEWIGRKHKSKWPYGRILVTFSLYNSKWVQAHRVSWVIHNGEIPRGTFVLHKCDNPFCVNPKHLFLGDCLANQRDMIAKGRAAHRERHPAHKLTEKDVAEIRRIHAKSRIGFKKTASAFGVHKGTILDILNNITWYNPMFVPPAPKWKARKTLRKLRMSAPWRK